MEERQKKHPEKRQSEICCESQAFVVDSVGSAGAVWKIIVSECLESEDGTEDGKETKIEKKNTK